MPAWPIQVVGAGEEPGTWSVAVATTIQTFAALCELDGSDRVPRLDQFLATLPPPRDLRESVIFEGLVSRLRARYTMLCRTTAAQRAAVQIIEHFAKPLNVTLLARSVGCSPRTLRRCFKQDVGCPIRELHARARVHDALTRIASGEKVWPSALAAGYRRDKDLCRAARRFAGITPAAVRRLDAAQLEAVLRKVRGPFDLHTRHLGLESQSHRLDHARHS